MKRSNPCCCSEATTSTRVWMKVSELRVIVPGKFMWWWETPQGSDGATMSLGPARAPARLAEAGRAGDVHSQGQVRSVLLVRADRDQDGFDLLLDGRRVQGQERSARMRGVPLSVMGSPILGGVPVFVGCVGQVVIESQSIGFSQLGDMG